MRISCFNEIKSLTGKSLLFSPFLIFSFNALKAQENLPPPPPPPPSNYQEPMLREDPWGNRQIHFGLNVMPGMYWLVANTSNDSPDGSSLGFGYGLNLEFYFTPNYAIVTGIEITSFNAKYSNDNPAPSAITLDSSITHNESLQYLQIPFMLKMKTSPIGKYRIFGQAGLNIGFLLKATDDYTTLILSKSSVALAEPSGNNYDIYRQTDFFRIAVDFGLGTEYHITGTSALQMSLNYDNGFTNITSSPESKINSKAVNLMIGILF